MQLCLVLVCPSLAANIGAVARAMANFGVDDLRLVNPPNYLDKDTQAIAKKGEFVLNQAQCFTNLASTVADMEVVLGTSIRKNRGNFSVQPLKEVLTSISMHIPKKMAVVFGRESSGLSNAELSHCTHLAYIPSIGSLNLSHAVAILLHSLGSINSNLPPKNTENVVLERPSLGEITGFKQQLFELLNSIHFAPADKQHHLWQRLSGLFNRIHLSPKEVRLGRAILRKIKIALAKKS